MCNSTEWTFIVLDKTIPEDTEINQKTTQRFGNAFYCKNVKSSDIATQQWQGT